MWQHFSVVLMSVTFFCTQVLSVHRLLLIIFTVFGKGVLGEQHDDDNEAFCLLL
jgi:hypothetical protein